MARAGHPLRVGPGRGAPGVRRNRIDRTIYARLFLPALPWEAGDKAEVRTVNLHDRRAVTWVEDLSRDYAQTDAGFTSFFPDHP